MPMPYKIHHRHLILVARIAILLGSLPVIDVSTSAGAPVGDPPATVALGDPGALPDYELAVVNVDFDAESLLRAYDPAMRYTSDTAYVMVQIEATYFGDDSGRPAEDMELTLTDSERNVYDPSCPAWPFPPESITLQPGETARFNLCFLTPFWLVMPTWIMTEDGTEVVTGPDDGMQLIAHTNLMTDQWPLTFALGEPDPDVTPDCACVPPTPPPPCGCVMPTPEETLA